MRSAISMEPWRWPSWWNSAAYIRPASRIARPWRSVSAAFANLVSSRAGVTANEEAVRAARVAAEGVRQEQQVGLRTTLDVLNAELELRGAEISLAVARRNDYVAQAQLLAAMGVLDAASLAEVETYDAAANYERVRRRGALPWDFVVETLDRLGAPAIRSSSAGQSAPIDRDLGAEVVRTAP